MARGETFDDWIREMVVVPKFVVKSYPRFCTRGYAFTTQKKRRSSTTYDAGVCSASGYVRFWKSSIWAWLDCDVLFSIVIGTTTLQIEV